MSCNCGLTLESSCPFHGYWPKKVEELQAQNKELVEVLEYVQHDFVAIWHEIVKEDDINLTRDAINLKQKYLTLAERERKREAVVRAAKDWAKNRYSGYLECAVEELEALEAGK